MNSDGAKILKRCGYTLLVFEALLGVAYLLWPEYRWGQGRRSYFNFENTLTLASWLASMQLVGVSILAFMGFHNERRRGKAGTPNTAWTWLFGGVVALVISLAEITRFHQKLKLLGYPDLDVYEQFVIFPLWFGLLVLFGWFVLSKLRQVPGYSRYGMAWLIMWGLELLLAILYHSHLVPQNWITVFTLVTGLAYLFGCTFLLMAMGGHILRSPVETQDSSGVEQQNWDVSFPAGSFPISLVLTVGGMTFTIIFLQILLFRMLMIFGDHMTANSVISIALLGIAVGGLIGASTAFRAPLQTMIAASLLLPFSILAAFGTTVSFMDTPLLASILLTLPFVCGSTVITIVLARRQPHVVYFIDLIGAGLGALLVGGAFSYFREESSLLFLGTFTFLIAGCCIISYPKRRTRNWLLLLTISGAFAFATVGGMNMQYDWLNVGLKKISKRYPGVEKIFSKSSFVGRYDVVRRRPTQKSLKAYENGRVIDTIRRNTEESYQIDPRVPHTLMEDPVILILGLSGDGIIKTSKFLGKKVIGIELNPAIVRLQTNELAPYNGNSYEDIDVAVMDGRTFVEQSNEKYDMITLMNAHSARGRTGGRAASPEYLHTREAIEAYLEHLTDRGVVIVEEPVSLARREVPVWKLVVTMRQALLDQGFRHPEQHFFIFQWRTKTNNYIQILMKKYPFTEREIARLKQWLQEVDNRKALEALRGQRLGPITTKTTILYSPGETFKTNYARILRGEVDEVFLQARNLQVTTDDRPFHFDVDPARPEFKRSYNRTLIMTALLLPFLLSFLVRYRAKISSALEYVFVVTLTGMGYFLIEVVLIQWYEIFLGSPVVTFATILGTLLIFSGLGSLWSGHIGRRGLYTALGAIIVFLLVHQWWIPSLLPLAASLPMSGKVAVVVLSIAPLAFCMGVPFPFVLRTGKERFTESTAAILFAINGAASALAVPLTLNLSSVYGFQGTFYVAMLLYLVVGLLLIAVHKPTIQLFANGSAVLVFSLLVISPWFISRPVQMDTKGQQLYRVYAINYGSSFYREDKIIQGGSSRNRLPFAWFFWIIQGQGRTILVDSGFDDSQMAKKWNIWNYVRPVERLQQLGIAPSEVSDVILTHAHWDHIGDLASYKNAVIWMQEDEYLYATSLISAAKPKTKGMRWEDIQVLLAAEQEGRLRLIRGEKALLPGITMTLGGAHTPGFQYVSVDTLDGPVIIAGDASYLYKNNRWHIPIGNAVDHRANLTAIMDMHRKAASPFFILPGHDPSVMRQFPQVSEGIVQITAVAE